MRGARFHNELARRAKELFELSGWHVQMEKRIQDNDVTTYIDLYATQAGRVLACEIETTDRHALDNAHKAIAVDLALCFVVPTLGLKRCIMRKLSKIGLTSRNQHINVFLLGELEAMLARPQLEQQPGNVHGSKEK